MIVDAILQAELNKLCVDRDEKKEYMRDGNPIARQLKVNFELVALLDKPPEYRFTKEFEAEISKMLATSKKLEKEIKDYDYMRELEKLQEIENKISELSNEIAIRSLR